MLQSNKKLTILCILEILKKYTDEAHPLTQGEIVKKLYSVYGFECERKSVGASIDSLIDFGYDIVKIDGGGCYLAAREFESSEIAFLIDAVFTSKNISSKHAKELALKLSGLCSVYEQKHFKYVHKADEVARTVNKLFFYNVGVINEAIDKGKRVAFVYNYYDTDKSLKARSDKPYTINPYFMLNNNGKYYLVCNREGFKDLNHYRLDYITDIQLTDEAVTPVTALAGFEKGLDIAKYANENTYMFGGESVNATLRLDGKGTFSTVLDWFGAGARFYERQSEDGGQYFAEIRASELAVVYWALQYGGVVEVVSPEGTRKRIAEIALKTAERYGK